MTRRPTLALLAALGALALALVRRALCRHFYEPALNGAFVQRKCHRCGAVRYERRDKL